MEFKYGIAPDSLVRWLAFQRIAASQELRASRAGMTAQRSIVGAELDAIEYATLECELRKAESAFKPRAVARRTA